MEHSKKFSLVKRFYIMKMWNLDKLADAVKMQWITEVEYKEITGLTYNVQKK